MNYKDNLETYKGKHGQYSDATGTYLLDFTKMSPACNAFKLGLTTRS
jgi:hypothetical protein